MTLLGFRLLPPKDKNIFVWPHKIPNDLDLTRYCIKDIGVTDLFYSNPVAQYVAGEGPTLFYRERPVDFCMIMVDESVCEWIENWWYNNMLQLPLPIIGISTKLDLHYQEMILVYLDPQTSQVSDINWGDHSNLAGRFIAMYQSLGIDAECFNLKP